VAFVVNAGGARLWHCIDAVSSSNVATKFWGAFQDEVGSMKTENPIYCVFHKQDGPPNVLHHRRLLGFPFSENSCPWEIELVVTLIKALIPRGMPSISRRIKMNKVHEIEKNWGSSAEQDENIIKSLQYWQYQELIEMLLDSFPSPILDPREMSKYSVRPSMISGPHSPQTTNASLVALASISGRPQGEILRAIGQRVDITGWVENLLDDLHDHLTHTKGTSEFRDLMENYRWT